MLPFVRIDQTPRPATPQRRLVPIGLVAAVGLALSGCATPALESAVEIPSQFAATPVSGEELEVTWWERFGDPVLSGLVQRAERENRDIRIAAERVRAARAGETISRSWLMPTISGVAGGVHQDAGYDWPITERFPETNAAGGGLGVSWEIDLAGGLRAGARAAAADALAAEHGERGVRLLVMSDVATNYFTLVGALRQLETVRAISAAQDETLRLVAARHRVGLATNSTWSARSRRRTAPARPFRLWRHWWPFHAIASPS